MAASFDFTEIKTSPTINITQFSHDALSRATKIEERTAGSVTSTKQHLWCGSARCEERDGTGSLSNGKQFFGKGEVIFAASASTTHFFTFDHLGSVREMTHTTGASLLIDLIVSYEPYGRLVYLSTSGTFSDFGYAGMYFHQNSGMNQTLFRNYAPSFARWLSRDPLGENIGTNLFEYANNAPTIFMDPYGLACCSSKDCCEQQTQKCLKAGRDPGCCYKNDAACNDSVGKGETFSGSWEYCGKRPPDYRTIPKKQPIEKSHDETRLPLPLPKAVPPQLPWWIYLIPFYCPGQATRFMEVSNGRVH